MSVISRDKYYALVFSVLAGVLLFIPFLGGLHLFDWDEINFAESAREMIITGNFLDVQINFEPFWEKPPLYIWLQVLSMKIFGINEFAARFPNAICGIISLYVIYLVGRKVRNIKFGWIWMLSYLGSILPFFYFKSGIIDPWFNLFIFSGLSLLSFYFHYPEKRLLRLGLSAASIGLAILTKGPVALLVLFLVYAFLIITNWKSYKMPAGHLAFYLAILIFTGGFWFILQVLYGNAGIIRDFVVYQIRLFTTHDAGHSGFFFYHFVILFFGVFPASIFALPSLFMKNSGDDRLRSFTRWMKVLFWIVLVLFTIVQTKIVHYSSLAYFPLTYLASLSIYDIVEQKRNFSKTLRVVVFITGGLYSLLIIGLSLVGVFKDKLLSGNMNMDAFTRANLNANVHWSGYEMIIGLVFFLLLYFSLFMIRKRGKSFLLLFCSMLWFTYGTILFITPKIEGYSQAAAIEFFMKLKGKNVYVATLGYKSYAPLFYSAVSPDSRPGSPETTWLLKGDPDKEAYLVFKINKKDKYISAYPELEILYEKNGFVFAVKK